MRYRKGKREREARKRQKRATFYECGAESRTFKLGHKKSGIYLRRLLSLNPGCPSVH